MLNDNHLAGLLGLLTLTLTLIVIFINQHTLGVSIPLTLKVMFSFDKVLLYNPAGLELTILLPQPPEC